MGPLSSLSIGWPRGRRGPLWNYLFFFLFTCFFCLLLDLHIGHFISTWRVLASASCTAPQMTCLLLIIPALLLFLWAFLHDKLPLFLSPTHTHTLSLIFTFTSSQCQTKPWKLLIIFSLSLSLFVWIESNKDPFLFDVIKLLRLDLGVRVNFFPEHRGELSEDFRCQALFQASRHLVFPPPRIKR